LVTRRRENKFQKTKRTKYEAQSQVRKKLEINTSNFPELVNNSSKQSNVKQSNIKQSNIITEVNKKPSFLDKINTEKVNIEKDELINSHVKLQDGWVEFKRDRSNGKIITNYSFVRIFTKNGVLFTSPRSSRLLCRVS
jgi:hypothetical protein